MRWSAEVVLADARRVDCDADHEPELFWALRGAGGGQFGVVTSLVFATVPEPRATRFELRWPATTAAAVVAAWQDWAPDAPDDITANLTVIAEHGDPLRVVVFGAALRDTTRRPPCRTNWSPRPAPARTHTCASACPSVISSGRSPTGDRARPRLRTGLPELPRPATWQLGRTPTTVATSRASSRPNTRTTPTGSSVSRRPSDPTGGTMSQLAPHMGMSLDVYVASDREHPGVAVPEDDELVSWKLDHCRQAVEGCE